MCTTLSRVSIAFWRVSINATGVLAHSARVYACASMHLHEAVSNHGINV